MLDCTDHSKLRLRRVSSQLCFSGETKAGPTVQDLYDLIWIYDVYTQICEVFYSAKETKVVGWVATPRLSTPFWCLDE